MTEQTIVHLMRHGEVYNPDKILYGRLPGFVLSDLGHEMAAKVADTIKDRDIVEIWASPLERAQQTAAPTAEADNVFEGERVSVGDGVLRQPKSWRYLYDPFKPSWGEPYKEVASRMKSAVDSAREAARGHEILLVSHQLPVWVSRLDFENRRLWHDPRHELKAIVYTEPAADLVAKAQKGAGA